MKKAASWSQKYIFFKIVTMVVNGKHTVIEDSRHGKVNLHIPLLTKVVQYD